MRRRRIPDRLALALALASAPAALLAGLDGAALAWHLAAGATALAGGLALAARGWLGGGDAKLVAAVACWTGFGALAPFLTVTALAVGLHALLLLARRREAAKGLPCAPAVALGGLAALPASAIFRGLLTSL